MAEAGEGLVVGKGWLKWIIWDDDWCEWWLGWWLGAGLFGLPAPFGATVCIVVSVVVSDRTDGAGDEKVLSPPRRP